MSGPFVDHVIFPSYCDANFFTGWHIYSYPLISGVASRPRGIRSGWLNQEWMLRHVRAAALEYGHTLTQVSPNPPQDYRFIEAFAAHFPEGVLVRAIRCEGPFVVPAEFVAEHPFRAPLLVDFGYGIERPYWRPRRDLELIG